MRAALRVVFVTTPDLETAKNIARTVVGERLVACVNLVPSVTSIYRWQGAIEESAEVLCVMKTVQERLAALIERVAELHPSKVPEVVAVPVETALGAYADWVADSTGHIAV